MLASASDAIFVLSDGVIVDTNPRATEVFGYSREEFKKLSLADQQFFEDAMTNLAAISKYGAPFYVQLESFEHREASGLQITRSPGKNIVYLGCVMLIIGIFMMFYIMPQRLWLMVKPLDGKLQLILAGSGLRNKEDFSKHFVELTKAFELKVIATAESK